MAKKTVRFVQMIATPKASEWEKPSLFALDELGRIWIYRTSVGSPEIAQWHLTGFNEARRFQFAADPDGQ